MNDEILKELKELNKNLKEESRENRFISFIAIALALIAMIAGIGQFVFDTTRDQLLAAVFGGILIGALGVFIWILKKVDKD